ncbi:TadE/TadG family type IV pilus assembly protein [Effusibacillus dendaii]|uniref:TadE-like domain-containing protein n=1 Tax=Effusibacillus dendaii TaxID=2743772 RepID=A0A7I8DCQ9_9BACL|nr:TadE/TadG family type IV pilus assembly protein [Effusibacillus dendaii]BCJ86616.1 hypothetical protein skT53_16010 [Effusibacillus dendaii]
MGKFLKTCVSIPLKKYARDQQGQALSEFVMILPILLLLMMGALIMGLIVYAKLVVVLAASQGARVGGAIYNDQTLSVWQKQQKITNTALSILTHGLSGVDRKVSIRSNGDQVEVTVSYRQNVLVPVIRSLFGNQSTFLVEYTAVARKL